MCTSDHWRVNISSHVGVEGLSQSESGSCRSNRAGAHLPPVFIRGLPRFRGLRPPWNLIQTCSRTYSTGDKCIWEVVGLVGLFTEHLHETEWTAEQIGKILISCWLFGCRGTFNSTTQTFLCLRNESHGQVSSSSGFLNWGPRPPWGHGTVLRGFTK